MAPTGAWKGVGSNQFLEENKVVATFCRLGSINQFFLGSLRFFFKRYSVKAVLESCYCVCSLCRTCQVISFSYFLISQEGFSSCTRFLGISFPSLLPAVAVPSGCALACRLEELFPQKQGNLCSSVSFSLLKGLFLFLPFQQRHWEILAPTGRWLFMVIPPSFLSRILLFCVVETETWRCLIPQGTEV